MLRVARTEDRKTVIFDNAGKLGYLAAFGAARYRLAEPPVENAGEEIGVSSAQRLLRRELRGERFQSKLRQQIERERVARKGMPREIQREDAAHAEIPEENFAIFGVNTLPAADKLRAAGAAQPRETADGFRVGLERAENGREGDHLVSQRTEKVRSAAGRSDHAVGKKLLARAGGEGKAAALRGDGGDLRRAALRNAQRLAAETQYVEHGGGGVAARIDAAFFIRDRPEPERAKERAQRAARRVRENGRDEIRPVIVLRRNVRIREIAPPVAGFEQFFADAVRLFKNRHVRSGLPGGDRRAEPARAAADHGDTARRFFSSHGMILPDDFSRVNLITVFPGAKERREKMCGAQRTGVPAAAKRRRFLSSSSSPD